MKNTPITDLERSLGLIFLDTKRPFLAVQPKWKRTFVGEKCVVLRFQDITVAGDRRENGGRLGKIITKKSKGEFNVQVELPLHYDYRKCNKGKKTSIYDDSGNPLHEINLLVAAKSDEVLDRFMALSSFISHDKELADQLLATVETPTPEKGFGANDIHQLMSLTTEPYLFRKFVDQWELKKFKEAPKELQKWRTAAMITLARRKEIADPNEFEKTSHYWVFPAIAKAARACAGVPEIDLHREIVNIDRKKAGLSDYLEATIRNALDTLGFEWIPDTDDWTQYWLPLVAKALGLGRAPVHIPR